MNPVQEAGFGIRDGHHHVSHVNYLLNQLKYTCVLVAGAASCDFGSTCCGSLQESDTKFLTKQKSIHHGFLPGGSVSPLLAALTTSQRVRPYFPLATQSFFVRRSFRDTGSGFQSAANAYRRFIVPATQQECFSRSPWLSAQRKMLKTGSKGQPLFTGHHVSQSQLMMHQYTPPYWKSSDQQKRVRPCSLYNHLHWLDLIKYKFRRVCY